MSIPLRVTARLSTPTSGIIQHDTHLDGPLAWAEAVTGDYPPITREHAPEIPLPLAKWEQDGHWGWKTSRAHYAVLSYGTLELRKKPADVELVRYTREKKNHHALGPHKARDLVVETAVIPRIWWDVEATDEAWLRRLLGEVTHLGGHRSIGLGRVTDWHVTPGEWGAWADRSYTPPTRAPYWHPERRAA